MVVFGLLSLLRRSFALPGAIDFAGILRPTSALKPLAPKACSSSHRNHVKRLPILPAISGDTSILC